MAEQLGRLWRTVKWLKPSQTWGRALRRLKKARIDTSAPPSSRLPLSPFVGCQRRSHMTSRYHTCVVGTDVTLPATGRWEHDGLPRLAQYHLHYLDEITASPEAPSVSFRAELISNWVKEHPPADGPGWEPYVISLRVVNLLKYLAAAPVGQDLAETIQSSVAIQVRVLLSLLETHLLGNHLWANAKALIFAGLFFNGKEAEGWLSQGLRILAAEIEEQILEDGGHFELSPMYQATLSEDALDLIQWIELFPHTQAQSLNAVLRRTAPKMLAWLETMTHPDGAPAQFNDTALNHAVSFAALREYEVRVLGKPEANSGPRHLKESGYTRLSEDSFVAILDTGQIGPDYLPGHAHADTLSFEASLAGQRLFVNGGISTYETNKIRLIERGTMAHNTVSIDGKNSSEVWGSFRVGRRARTFDRSIFLKPQRSLVSAAHDGFTWLEGAPIHRRSWTLTPGRFKVTDRITPQTEAVAYLRIHPTWEVNCDQDRASLRHKDTVVSLTCSTELRVKESYWAPNFGKREPCTLIEIPVRGTTTTTIDWNSA